MNVLMVDVGGTNLKVMVSPDGEVHKMPSGQTLTASEMVQGVLGLSADLEFDRVSLGIPGLVEHGKPALEPGNLGGGWVDFDYSKAFGRPVRCINDAAMQALGNYNSGRLLFLGFGTSVGATVIVDDIVVPIEVGSVKLNRIECLVDRLSKAALKRDGREHWSAAALEAVELFQNVFKPDQTVLGGEMQSMSIPFRHTACVWITDPRIPVHSVYGKTLTSSRAPAQLLGESIAMKLTEPQSPFPSSVKRHEENGRTVFVVPKTARTKQRSAPRRRDTSSAYRPLISQRWARIVVSS